MAMKYWRYQILINLYDFPRDAYVLSGEPRAPYTGPHLRIGGVLESTISWSRFDHLIRLGDLIEVSRHIVDANTYIYYTISESGKQALEALPHFARRAARQAREVLV